MSKAMKLIMFADMGFGISFLSSGRHTEHDSLFG